MRLRRWQEIDRIDDCHRGDIFLGAEVKGTDPIDNLLRQHWCIHVGCLQYTERHGSVRLDRKLENDLPAQSRVLAQLAVIQPVQRRLVTIEDDLYLLCLLYTSDAADE